MNKYANTCLYTYTHLSMTYCMFEVSANLQKEKKKMKN